MNTMHDIIKTRRRELGLTQKELADRLFISDKTVSRWESGNQLPEAQMIPDLAQALQLSVNALYGIEETEAVQKQEAPRRGTALWYKILMTAGMLAALFAAMGLIKFNIFYQEQMVTMGWRTICFIQLFAACALLTGAQIAYTLCSKRRLCGKIYLRTEMVFGGLAAIEIVFIFLWLLPFSLSIAYDVWYGAVALSVACGAAVFLLWQKRRLRRNGAKCGKAISRIAVILLIVSVVTLIVVFIAAAVNRQYMTDYYTTAQGLTIAPHQSEEYYMLETNEHKANFYSYLLAAVPVMSALIMLHVENLIVSERHSFIQLDSE